MSKKTKGEVALLFDGESVVFDQKETRDRFQKLIELEGGTIQRRVGKKTTMVLHWKYRGSNRTAEKAAIELNKNGAGIQIEHAWEYISDLVSDQAWLHELCEHGELERFAQASHHGCGSVEIDGVDFKDAFPARTQIRDLMTFRNCGFDGLVFENVFLASLISCTFEKTNLGADFRVDFLESSDLSRCEGALYVTDTLKDCTVDGLRIANARTIEGSSLVGSTLQDVKHATITSSNLNKATIRSLDGGTLKDSRFDDVTISLQGDPRPNMKTTFGEHLPNRSLYYTRSRWTTIDASTCSFKGLHFPECGMRTSTFTDCNLTQASFAGLQLCGVTFKNCDLRKANFKGTRLYHVDFTGSNVTGADFTDAVVQGGTIADLGLDGAKGLNHTRSLVSPALNALAGHLNVATYHTSIHVVTDAGQEVTLEASLGSHASAWIPGPTRLKTMNFQFSGHALMPLFTFGDLYSVREIKLDSLKVKSSGSPVKGNALKQLMLQAWHETFGLEPLSDDQAKQAVKAKRKASSNKAAKVKAKRKTLLALLDGTTKGVNAWNRKDIEASGPFNKMQMEDAVLNKVKFYACPESNFAKAQLKQARFAKGSFRKTCFDGAQLEAATFASCDLQEASFVDANLVAVTFRQASIVGVDFTGADLTDVVFRGCLFNEQTVWPKNFKMPNSGLKWHGKGPDPSKLAALDAAAKKADPVDLATFRDNVAKQVDSSRLKKALKMLKKDSFQLFVEASDDGISGVVKSQTDASLVYSCHISSSGEFCCCTQNLNPCGGLRGALCKHLLVLIFGIANDESVNTSALDLWVEKSTIQSPNLDKDAMSAVLLKYKGAEAGEIDWRPTETVPEDYYAF